MNLDDLEVLMYNVCEGTPETEFRKTFDSQAKKGLKEDPWRQFILRKYQSEIGGRPVTPQAALRNRRSRSQSGNGTREISGQHPSMLPVAVNPPSADEVSVATSGYIRHTSHDFTPASAPTVSKSGRSSAVTVNSAKKSAKALTHEMDLPLSHEELMNQVSRSDLALRGFLSHTGMSLSSTEAKTGLATQGSSSQEHESQVETHAVPKKDSIVEHPGILRPGEESKLENHSLFGYLLRRALPWPPSITPEDLRDILVRQHFSEVEANTIAGTNTSKLSSKPVRRGSLRSLGKRNSLRGLMGTVNVASNLKSLTVNRHSIDESKPPSRSKARRSSLDLGIFASMHG